MQSQLKIKILSIKYLSLATGLLLIWLLYFDITNINAIYDKLLLINFKGLSSLEDHDPAVSATLRNTFLIPPSKLPYNLSTDEDYRLRSVSYSWPYINKVLVQLFENEPPGFFVEAGALDGEFLSNSLRLERERGWSGLLIEPEPKNYLELTLKRRKAWISNSCLSNSSHPQQIVMVSTQAKDDQLLDPLAIRGGTHILGVNDHDEVYMQFENTLIRHHFESQCFPLYSYLLALNVTTIDFLSLDLQGPEVPIFLTIPFDKIYVRSVVIEHESNLPTFDFHFVRQMNKLGFLIVTAGGAPDYFFVNVKDDKLVNKIDDWQYQNAVDNNYTVISKLVVEN